MSDTATATAPRATVGGLDTSTAVGIVVVGALLALAGLSVGFRGSVSTSIGR